MRSPTSSNVNITEHFLGVVNLVLFCKNIHRFTRKAPCGSTSKPKRVGFKNEKHPLYSNGVYKPRRDLCHERNIETQYRFTLGDG